MSLTIVKCTNRDLSEAIANGTFRSDLFYRLNVFPIQVPPTAKSREDIPILLEYFVKRFTEKMGKRIHPDRQGDIGTLREPSVARQYPRAAEYRGALGHPLCRRHLLNR
jgi:transcriptional regulator with GAF, ATPase, and Fis domain